jgi:prolyl oligopeptidase
MKKISFLILSILLVMSCHGQWNYPTTKTVDVSDTYFGRTYNDPYRWLENLKDTNVIAWFKA